MQATLRFILIFSILISCQQARKNEVATKKKEARRSDSLSVRFSRIKVEVAKLGNGFFGYTIFVDSIKVIYQPTIPAVKGSRGFSTFEKAKTSGEFVANKIRHNQFPPTITIHELDSLGVLK